MASSDHQHASASDLEQILVEATSGSPVVLEAHPGHALGKASLLCTSYVELMKASSPDPADAIPGEITEPIDETTLARMGSSQVSGHAIIFHLPEGRIMKHSNMHEVHAYQVLQLHSSLRPFTARYFGYTHKDLHQQTTSRNLDKSQEFRKENVFIVLEDLTHNYKRPCVMDVKLGLSTVDEHTDANAEKVARKTRRALETTSGRYGARVDGLHAFQSKTGAEIRSGREAWNKTLAESFFLFLHTGEGTEIREDVSLQLIDQLAALHTAMTKHRFSMSFVQSSLLFIYESDPSEPPRSRVALIDFDHAHFEDPDAEAHIDHSACGCVFGVANIVLALHTLLTKGVPGQQHQDQTPESSSTSP